MTCDSRSVLGTDRAAMARLRRSVEAAGFSSAGLARVFGEEGYVPEAGVLPPEVADLAAHHPLRTLIPLFLLELPVARADAQRIVDVAELAALGLVEDADPVRPLWQLVPSGDAVFVSDREDGGGADHVMGVTPSSALLGNLTLRGPVRRALDLGTGGGIQAFLLSGHAEQVVATDVSARALDAARFNLALNGVSGVELRQGSWLEPVAGERFDLVVCNPPFVVSPANRYVYRDSGLHADELVQRLVAELPALLEEGGTAQLLLSWVIRDGEDWPDPVAGWVSGNGCDAVLLRYRIDDPAGYAEHWNRDDAQTATEWTRWYEDELGAVAIAYGALALRRRTGGGGFGAAEVVSDRVVPASAHVERLLTAQALLSTATDEDLLDRRFALAPDHRLDQALTSSEGSWLVEHAVLRLRGGLGFEAEIDAFSAALLARLDTGLSLRAVLEEALVDVGRPRAELHAAAVPLVRGMLERGFLTAR